MSTSKQHLNLGCGNDIRKSTADDRWVNLDSAKLPGVDVVTDLTQFPWALEDNSFDTIVAYDILEHLPNLARTMEELWRVLKPDGVLEIRVPYWNSHNHVTDPTHIRQFNQNTLRFWDVDSQFHKTRPYYSTAQYRHESLVVNVGFMRWQWDLPEGFLQKLALKFAGKLGNVARNLYVRMRAVK